MRISASLINSICSAVWTISLTGLLVAAVVVPTMASATVTLIARGTDQNGTLLLPGALLAPGDQVTVEVTARSDGELTFGLGASATGYESDFQFNSGETVQSIFSQLCVAGPVCFGGLDQSGLDPSNLVETNFGPGPEIQFINALSLSGTSATGEIDVGVSGLAGDPQAVLVFDVLFGTLFQQQGSINIGSLIEFGDALILTGGATGVVETVWVVPEPGTALLTWLGLAGLASWRRPGRGSWTGV